MHVGEVGDEVVLDLMAADSPQAASRLTDSEAALQVTQQVWGPILRSEGIRPEVRHDPAPEEAFLWLVHVQLSLLTYLGRRDDEASWTRVRMLIRRFVLPAFLEPAERDPGP